MVTLISQVEISFCPFLFIDFGVTSKPTSGLFFLYYFCRLTINRTGIEKKTKVIFPQNKKLHFSFFWPNLIDTPTKTCLISVYNMRFIIPLLSFWKSVILKKEVPTRHKWTGAGEVQFSPPHASRYTNINLCYSRQGKGAPGLVVRQKRFVRSGGLALRAQRVRVSALIRIAKAQVLCFTCLNFVFCRPFST